MRKLFLLFLFSTYALSDNLFFNTVTKKWIGVHSIPCSKGVNSMVDARSASQWGIGNYFLGENGSCYEIVKILQGEDKTPLGGKRWAHGSYENGVVTGVYKIYGNDNKLLAEIIFKDGIKDGRAKEYYKDGILKLEEEYKDGLLHGQRVEYEFNGRPLKVNFYQNNIKHGIERIYNVQGRPYQEFEYRNNNKLSTYKRYFYDKDGDFARIESYSGDTKDGQWLYYDKKGNIVKEVVYANGVQKQKQDYFAQNLITTPTHQVPKSDHYAQIEIQNPAQNTPKYTSEISGGPRHLHSDIQPSTSEAISLEDFLNSNKQKPKEPEPIPHKKNEIQQTTKIASTKEQTQKITVVTLTDKEIELLNPPINTNNITLCENMAIFYNKTVNKWFGVLTKDSSNNTNDATTKNNIQTGFKIGKLNREISNIPTGIIRTKIEPLLEVEVQNGIINGWFISYFKNGINRLKIYYVDGKKQGIAKEFDTSGALIAKWLYIDDKVNGLATFYYPNGTLKAAIPFNNSIVNGTAKFFNQKGELVKKARFVNGVMS